MRRNPLKWAAKAAGEKYYFTGIPCKHGHVCRRFTKGGECVECQKMYSRIHSKTPHGIAYRHKWRAQEHVRQKDRNYSALYSLRRRYGINDWEKYRALIEACGNQCEICHSPLLANGEFHHGRQGNAACIDHDHRTGKVRGVLCNRCNRALGLLKDDSAILRAAVEYLESKALIE